MRRAPVVDRWAGVAHAVAQRCGAIVTCNSIVDGEYFVDLLLDDEILVKLKTGKQWRGAVANQRCNSSNVSDQSSRPLARLRRAA
jgi:hypothetical protein